MGNIYIGGTYQAGADFDPSTNIVNEPYRGGFYDCFIEKLDTNGDFVWVKTMGGSEQDNLEDLTVDDQGNIYSVGMFGDTVDFDPGVDTYNLMVVKNRDMFVHKLDINGDFKWVKSFSGVGNGVPRSIAIDNFKTHISQVILVIH